jgi:uncharacterized protein YacL
MALITNDAAMVQLARIYGVKALSIQALSIALRTQYRPGDRVELEIIKPGREAGQGVGYLEDGTMVVVDGASRLMGKKVAVVGSAVMGAISERPELAGRALIFLGLAEGIAIYGLIVAIMILGKLG